METLDIPRKILLLGIYDNIHDFINCILSLVNKKNYFSLINLIGLKKEIIGDDRNQKIINEYTKLETQSISEIKILENITKNFVGESKSIQELRRIIKSNFDTIFSPHKLNDVDIYKFRNLLYFLIKDKDNREQILQQFNEIIKKIDSTHVSVKLPELEEKLKSISENVTYPISFFDDMPSGLNKENYDNHIINLDKKNIDGARTKLPQTQLKENSDEKLLHKKRTNIEINKKDHSVGFIVNPGFDGDVLKFFKTEYYLDGNKIICKFEDKIDDTNYSIQISLSSNEITFITKLIEYTCQIFDDYWKLITVKNFKKIVDNDFYNKKISKKEIIEFINQIYKYISNKNKQEVMNDNTNKHLCQGLVAYILAGVKRFGDWIQMKLSKKLYLMLQTKDNLCKAYGILIGAPVEYVKDENKKTKSDDDDEEEIEEEKERKTKKKVDSSKIIIYNYKPSDDFNFSSFEPISSEFKIFDSTNHRDIKIGEDKMFVPFSGNIKIETNISRYWFHKYSKYKIKYMELKRKLSK